MKKPILENAKRICILFPEKEIEMMDEHAEKEGTTRSDLIRDAINRILPKKASEGIKS